MHCLRQRLIYSAPPPFHKSCIRPCPTTSKGSAPALLRPQSSTSANRQQRMRHPTSRQNVVQIREAAGCACAPTGPFAMRHFQSSAVASTRPREIGCDEPLKRCKLSLRLSLSSQAAVGVPFQDSHDHQALPVSLA